jgi:hypothetical protein
VGAVTTEVSGTSVCLPAGASGSTYALIPFLNSAVSGARSAITFTANGTEPGNALLDDGPPPAWRSTPAGAAFESRLRYAERNRLRPLMPAARRWYQALGRGHQASRSTIPSSVSPGDLIQLNTNGDDSLCNDPIYRTGRVVAVTDQAIVVADQGNPAGGYTDAEYQSLGVTFDTLVDPLDRANFGNPIDIDGNKHIVLFFTKTVNDLTPKTSDSYVGGFFAARDLFPTHATANLDGCATSNVGEIFYLMVPDPSRGSSFSKANVTTIAVSTLAHEYQHLINASRRLYVNTAAEDFEEVWLNEGLSHIAEELLFYRQSKLVPRSNIAVTSLQQTGPIIDAFNNDEIANVNRYTAYLQATSSYSPFSDNDSLETRGATWSFLRYAADHSTIAEQTIWRGLVNSTTTGLTNLQAVFGVNPLTSARDWSISIFTDDIVPVPPLYTQPSWNMRSILSELEFSTAYPLRVRALAPATSTVVALTGGSAGYATATVAPDAVASVSWAPVPTTVQVTVVRVR